MTANPRLVERLHLAQSSPQLAPGFQGLFSEAKQHVTLSENRIAALEAVLLLIYSDIPERPDMTEAGRVALMADAAGKAIGYPSSAGGKQE